MTAAHRRVLTAALVAAFGLTALTAGASGSTSVESTWYWSEYGVAHALYVNGITWRSGVDRMRQTHCWGLGHWLVKSDGTRLFSHFYCTATPTRGSQYDVVVNVTGPTVYAVSFASYVKSQTWYWSAQYTANALYKNGIRWLGTVDQVTSDACSPFGKHLSSDSSYYQHFYCSVHTSVRGPYTVVVNVTDKLSYTVKWVDFDNQLPATPAQPQPSVAQTATSSASSSSGGSTYTPPSTTTPDCDYYCNALSYVASKTPPSSSPSWINQALVNAALSDQQRTALIHQWGINDVPSSAAAWTGEIGCQNYAYVQTTAYTSVGAC